MISSVRSIKFGHIGKILRTLGLWELQCKIIPMERVKTYTHIYGGGVGWSKTSWKAKRLTKITSHKISIWAAKFALVLPTVWNVTPPSLCHLHHHLLIPMSLVLENRSICLWQAPSEWPPNTDSNKKFKNILKLGCIFPLASELHHHKAFRLSLFPWLLPFYKHTQTDSIVMMNLRSLWGISNKESVQISLLVAN